jgi:hypothetical protein
MYMAPPKASALFSRSSEDWLSVVVVSFSQRPPPVFALFLAHSVSDKDRFV